MIRPFKETDDYKKMRDNIMITSDVKNYILEELHRIEHDFNVKVLYACESGSRAWGFSIQICFIECDIFKSAILNNAIHHISLCKVG